MIGILLFGFGFVLGMLCGQGKLNWVRGAAGKARDAVFGSRPARAFSDPELRAISAKVETVASGTASSGATDPAARTSPAGFATAVKNILAFFIGLVGWIAKHPMLALGLVVLALFLMFGAPSCSPFGKSRGELRLEREIAQAELRTQETLRERDEAIAAIRLDTARTLEQIRLESQRGHDEIAAATPEHEEPLDPELVAAWRDALDRLCVPRADGNRSDTC